MTVIDQILNEWSFRCHDGIVDMNDPKKVAILNVILEENGIESSDLKDVDPNSETTPNTPKKELTEAEKFEIFIIKKYAVPGQGIIGLQNLYTAIDKDPQKTDLLNIIEKTSKTLTSGEISLNETDKKLFNLIMQYVKVSNGEPSELWFAILFGGQVEGGVKEEGKKQSDIVSDIKVGSSKISLKNYTEINTLDFGSLSAENLAEIKHLFTIFSIISGKKLTPSLTRDSINNLFTVITSEEFLKKFEEFIEVVEKYPNIDILQKLYIVIKPLLKVSTPDIKDGKDIKEIVNNFIKKINEIIKAKINTVNWWAIIKGGKKDIQNLYLLPSDEVIKRITSTGGQLNSTIKQFKGNGLYVNGNTLLNISKPSSEKDLKEEYEEYED
jgi:hypothetical protein